MRLIFLSSNIHEILSLDDILAAASSTAQTRLEVERQAGPHHHVRLGKLQGLGTVAAPRHCRSAKDS